MRIIRPATETDLPDLMQLFAEARKFMAKTGNPTQWTGGYPSEAQLRADQADGHSYVCEEDGVLLGTFFFAIEDDPTYRVIYDGQWLRDAPYGVIHRIAVRSHQKGVATFCVAWCASQCARQPGTDLRVDTHRDNIVMQRFLKKNGFVPCGIIHLANGAERIAFQRIAE